MPIFNLCEADHAWVGDELSTDSFNWEGDEPEPITHFEPIGNGCREVLEMLVASIKLV